MRLPDWRLAAVVLAVAVAGAGTAEAIHRHRVDSHGAPVLATAPTAAYGARLVSVRNAPGRVCIAHDGLAPSGGPLRPRLDPGPTGGVALWLPGMNARPCRAVLTSLSRSQATAFAAAVDAAKTWPSGRYNCPADDASSVSVFLFYAGRPQAEVVREGLAGCISLTAPGRASLEGAGLDDLGPQPKGLHGR